MLYVLAKAKSQKLWNIKYYKNKNYFSSGIGCLVTGSVPFVEFAACLLDSYSWEDKIGLLYLLMSLLVSKCNPLYLCSQDKIGLFYLLMSLLVSKCNIYGPRIQFLSLTFTASSLRFWWENELAIFVFAAPKAVPAFSVNPPKAVDQPPNWYM